MLLSAFVANPHPECMTVENFQADNFLVDDMAERCDRLEQEMLMRDGGLGIDTRSKASIKSGDSFVDET